MGKYLNAVVDMGFHFSNQAHLWHFQTESYAEHMTLGEFYKFMDVWLDTFVECYMEGSRSISSNEAMPLEVYKDSSQLTKWTEQVVCKYLKGLREDVKDSPDLVNLIDDALTQAYQTMYKLRLK